MPLRDGVGFLAFDELVSRCVPGTGIRDARIRQVIAVNSLADYMSRWAASDLSGESPPGSDGCEVTIGFGTFLPNKRSFRPSASAVLRGIYSGFLVGLAGVVGALMPAKVRVPGCFVVLLGTGDGDVFRQASDARFAAFCANGPVSRLHKPAQLVVQTSRCGRSAIDPRIYYAPRPLYQLLRIANVRYWQRLALAAKIAWAVARETLLVLMDRQSALLIRDQAESELVRSLVIWGTLERVLLTNSSQTRQALWLRQRCVPSAMIWYSENNKWMWDDGVEQRDHPAFRHMDVEEHWVWTAAQRHWLLTLGTLGVVHVVGPILWYLPAETAQGERVGKLWITLFDITPVSDSPAREQRLPDGYYTAERCSMFLVGAMEAVRRARSVAGVDVGVRLKTKRPRKGADSGYMSLVQSLARTDHLVLVDWTEDIFALASGSVLSIVQPFSSPGLVAASVGARSCYFDAPGVLARPIHLDEGIEFVQSVDQLSECVLKAIKAIRSDLTLSGGL